MNDPRELLSRLAAPFAAEDLEWRLQIAYEDRMQGIAVPYVTNRAIQNRLDDVMGPDRWHNEFKPWHSTGKRESQLCGISLYFEERGWITKWDGAEDSDIEPIKGGLSDSMKRAANQWGIGRVLYSMDTVWVNVEKKGKSFIIKPTERGKLDARYLETLKSLGLTPAKACGIQSLLIPALRAEEQAPAPTAKPTAQKGPPKPQEDTTIVPFPACEYTVLEAKAAGTTTQLILEAPEGKRCYAYAMGSHPELQKGAKLYHVEKRMVKKDNVVFYLLDSFEVIQQKDAA